MGSAFHQLCPRYNGSLTPTALMANRLWETVIFFKRGFLHSIGYLNCTNNHTRAQFIANASSCATTELSKLLNSCLTTKKNHVFKYCEKVDGRSGKILFWSIKNPCEVLNTSASNLSTYDFLHYILHLAPQPY